MASMKLMNIKGDICSMQISQLEDVSGDYESGTPFLIKVKGDSVITAELKLLKNKDYIETELYPGWNSEICKGIRGASGEIQIGR